MAQIVIMSGRFGSGKTEVSLNYALRLAQTGASPFLIDLDLVTPYFRTRERADEMGRQGVEVIAPFDVAQYLDLPAVNPRILGALEQPYRPVVLDVGGDRQGARALAQYALHLERIGYTMNFVVNPYRPFMDTIEGIVAAVHEIQASSRLHVGALISNPHLMSQSTPELFWEGHRRVRAAAVALGLPVSLVAMSESLFAQMGQPDLDAAHLDAPLLVIHRFFLMLDDA